MIKKMIALVVLTLGLMTANAWDIPFPECYPCPRSN